MRRVGGRYTVSIIAMGVISRRPQNRASDTLSVLVSRLQPGNLLVVGPSIVNYSDLEDAVVIARSGVAVAVTVALEFAVDKPGEDGNGSSRSASAG